MRKQEDVVTAPVDIVTLTAENAIWYYLYAKTATVFTYFTINCKLYLNISMVFDPKYFFASAPLKNLQFNTLYRAMLHKYDN